MRILLDTCVIMDAVQNRAPFADDAKKIFREAAMNSFIGCITAKASTDIYYLTHRCSHSDKDTRVILTKLFALFDVLDTAALDCKKAISSTDSFPIFRNFNAICFAACYFPLILNFCESLCFFLFPFSPACYIIIPATRMCVALCILRLHPLLGFSESFLSQRPRNKLRQQSYGVLTQNYNKFTI